MAEELLPFCECRCGKRVTKKGNRFIKGHHRRGVKHTSEVILLLSEMNKARFSNKTNREKAREKAIKQWSDPEARKQQSDRLLEYYKNNPDRIDEISEISKMYWSDKTNREKATKRSIEYYSDLNNRNAASKRTTKYYSDPNNRITQSKRMRNSKKHKISVDKRHGGNDICDHHVAYDFLRPEALTVKITRSFHGKIHHPKGCRFGTYGYSLID